MAKPRVIEDELSEGERHREVMAALQAIVEQLEDVVDLLGKPLTVIETTRVQGKPLSWTPEPRYGANGAG